jgi:hypothetical protein
MQQDSIALVNFIRIKEAYETIDDINLTYVLMVNITIVNIG